VGLERGPFSLLSTIEELLERKSIGSGLEGREYGRRNPFRCPRGTLCLQKLALTWPTSGCRLVGIVHPLTKVTEFVLLLVVQKLMRFERKILRKIYGPTKLTDGTWIIKTNEELGNLVEHKKHNSRH
jgi:hypothetical protein